MHNSTSKQKENIGKIGGKRPPSQTNAKADEKKGLLIHYVNGIYETFLHRSSPAFFCTEFRQRSADVI